MAHICYSCRSQLDLPRGSPVSVNATCDKCGSDVRVCRNCKFFDVKSYNECHEPQAERVVDKERRNRCDFFVIRPESLGAGTNDKLNGDSVSEDPKELARKKLAELFK